MSLRKKLTFIHQNVMTDINELLIKMAKEGNLPAMVSLLDQGANIHVYNDCVLIFAAENGHLEVVRLLLDHGADVHAEWDRALRGSAHKGHLEIVCLLLDRGADVHAGEDEALRFSACFGHLEIVRLLLDRGADIHAECDEALYLSAWNGHLEVVRLLLDRGADVRAIEDRSLRDSAWNGNLEVVRLLLDHGADVHALEDLAIQVAAKKGHLEIIVLLLNKGADPRHILNRTMKPAVVDAIVTHSQYRLSLDRETMPFFVSMPGLLRSRRAIRNTLPSLVKPYLYSPWSRFATESIELLHLEGDEETNCRNLRHYRDTLIAQVIDNPRWTHDFLLHNYSSVPWGDDSSTGLRSLIGEGNPRPSRRQLICRLPTSILEELAS